MKSSRATLSIALRSRSERRSPRRLSSPIFASRSRRRSSLLLSGRPGGGTTHSLIDQRKRRGNADGHGSRRDAGPPRTAHHPASEPCPKSPTCAATSAWPPAAEPPPAPDQWPRTSSVNVASLAATGSARPPDLRPAGILVARHHHP